jgi:hypothetical protein
MTKHHHILGLIFDQRLNWKVHIKDLKKARAMKKLNTVKSLAYIRNGAWTKDMEAPPTDQHCPQHKKL